MIKVATKVNLAELNSYCAKRIKRMGVAVGTFREYNQRRATLRQGGELKHNKSYGIYRQALRSKAAVTNSAVALSNIYGSKRTPKRNYFLLAFSKKFNKANNFTNLKSFYYKQPPVLDLYRRLGNLATASVKRAIKEYKTPPNSAKTIKIKGFNKPLIDTMQLLKSISYQPLHGMLEYMNRSTGEVKEI